jgi:hypothetical protein
MADNRTRSPIPESLPTDVVGPYAITELIRANEVRPRTRREISAQLLSVSLKKPKSTPMSLAGLMGADHAFYYERARVLLPFRTGARTYLGETAFLARASPARTRFAIIARSNSANTPII